MNESIESCGICFILLGIILCVGSVILGFLIAVGGMIANNTDVTGIGVLFVTIPLLGLMLIILVLVAFLVAIIFFGGIFLVSYAVYYMLFRLLEIICPIEGLFNMEKNIFCGYHCCCQVGLPAEEIVNILSETGTKYYEYDDP